MDGMRDFDPYLRFASKADEEEYRRRETERRDYIKAEEAKGTAQGDLHAVDAAIDQMADAKAHGADESPLFASRMASLKAARNELSTATERAAALPVQGEATPIIAQPSESPSHADDLGGALAALKAAGVGGGTSAAEPEANSKPVTAAAKGRTAVTSARV
jgi:hypothetical protein